MRRMRKILTAFALAALVAGCGARGVSATDARAEKEKSPLAELEKKVKEVVLVGATAGMDRAELSGQVGKVSVALREGKFCEASKGLGVLKFYVSRFWFLGRFQNKKDERQLTSLADKAARKIKQRADSLGMNCDAAE